MTSLLCTCWAVGSLLWSASAAAPSATAAATVQVVERLAVGALAPVSTSRPTSQVTTQFGSSVFASTVVGISGRPDQAYSIRLPQSKASPSGANLESMTAWSDNARGNIASGYSTKVDDKGRDVLRLAGNLSVPSSSASDGGTTASITLGIDYQ